MHYYAFLSDESLLTWLNKKARRLIIKVFTVFNNQIYVHSIYIGPGF